MTVKTINDEKIEADKVLITVPIKIRQGDLIKFSPALPFKKRAAIDNIVMPDGLKVIIEFSEKFFPDILFTGKLLKEMRSQDKLFYNAGLGKNSPKNVLSLFTVGAKASAYTDLWGCLKLTL